MALDYARSSTSGAEGFRYETKMTALVALRLFKGTQNFYLASNMTMGGKFDDIVFSAQIEDAWQTYFIQLKHRQNNSTTKKHITLADLQYKSKDFNIPKYNESFKSVARKFFSETDDPIFDKGFYCSKFVVYTNADVHQEVVSNNCHVVNNCKLLSTTDQPGVIFQFNQNSLIFNNIYNKYEIDHLVGKLMFFSSQSNETNIDDIILAELKNAFPGKNLDQSTMKFIAHEFVNFIQRRLGSSDNTARYLVPAEVKKVLNRLSGEAEFGRKRDISIQYLDTFLKSLQEQIASEKLIYLTNHVDTTVMCLAALNQMGLTKEPNSLVTLQNVSDDRPLITRKWFNGNDLTMVVDCEVDTLNVDVASVSEFLKHMKQMNETNRIILVATNNNVPAKDVSLSINAKKKKFNCSLKNLNDDSKKMLKEREVFFQGYKILLETIMPHNRALDDVFDLSAITQLVQGRQLNVGVKPVDEKSYYVTRVLIRQASITPDALNCADFEGCIAVSGMSHEEAVSYFNNFEVESFYDIISCPGIQINRKVVTLSELNPERQFEALEKTVNSPLHWFEKTRRNWHWKRSTTNIEDVIGIVANQYEYVPTDNIMRVQDKMVVVVAEPGMGKSTLLEHLAAETKRQCPHMWVILLALNDYTAVFNSTDFVAKAGERTKELLAQAAGIDSGTSKFNERLFNQCYENGNMIVLLDGFDEITPQLTQQGLAMINALRKSAISRIWISARPVVMDLLEKATSTISYSIKPFSDKDQKTFLKKFWKTQIPAVQTEKLNEFVEKLLCSLLKSFDNKLNQFTGIPLQTLMIAEIFQEDLNFYHTNGVLKLKEKLNGLELFVEFVRIKQRSHLNKSRIANALSYEDLKQLEDLREKELMNMALLTLLPLSTCETLVPGVSKTDRDLFKAKVAEGREKMGIVLSFDKDCPHFIHRTFAEYFVALYFSKNYATNRKFLSSDTFFSKAFEFVKYFFDRILCVGKILHEAVLDNDCAKVSELINSGVEVNGLDLGGRTALHVAASQPHSEQLIVLLLAAGANAEMEDGILNWSPLKYATQTGSVQNIAPLMEQTNTLHIGPGIIKVNWQTLLQAVMGDYFQLFCNLLHNGLCDEECLDVLSPQDWLGEGIIDGLTILHLAAFYNAEKIMRYLLRKNTRDCKLLLLESLDENGLTPLVLAASKGNFACVNVLLSAGANSLASDRAGANVCQFAVQAQDLELLCTVLGDATVRKADPLNFLSSSLTVLASDASSWGESTLDLLLSLYPELANGCTSRGMSPMILAATKGNVKAIRTLKKYNGNVNNLSLYGTPLHMATLGGHEDAVQELLNFPNIQVDILDESGATPLYVATSKGKVDIYHMLVKAGANVQFCTVDGNTLAHAVAGHLSKKPEIFFDLLQRGVDFKKENNLKVTAFSLLKDAKAYELLSALDPTIVPPPPSVNSTAAPKENKIKKKKKKSTKSESGQENIQALLSALKIDSVSGDNKTELLAKIQGLVKSAIEQKQSTSSQERIKTSAAQNGESSSAGNKTLGANPGSSKTCEPKNKPTPLMQANLFGPDRRHSGKNQIQNYRLNYGQNQTQGGLFLGNNWGPNQGNTARNQYNPNKKGPLNTQNKTFPNANKNQSQFDGDSRSNSRQNLESKQPRTQRQHSKSRQTTDDHSESRQGPGPPRNRRQGPNPPQHFQQQHFNSSQTNFGPHANHGFNPEWHENQDYNQGQSPNHFFNHGPNQGQRFRAPFNPMTNPYQQFNPNPLFQNQSNFHPPQNQNYHRPNRPAFNAGQPRPNRPPFNAGQPRPNRPQPNNHENRGQNSSNRPNSEQGPNTRPSNNKKRENQRSDTKRNPNPR